MRTLTEEQQSQIYGAIAQVNNGTKQASFGEALQKNLCLAASGLVFVSSMIGFHTIFKTLTK